MDDKMVSHGLLNLQFDFPLAYKLSLIKFTYCANNARDEID